ncbi:MAG TPA: thiamine pyrophosphate-dependent dehydrogenase E1 component subunit alpha [Terriglobia bacterium]|nr:thiamine pyrophosphate-dependent dehydrogenase E1 component subunit alpha [Terriglobia bacterium]
MAQAPSTKSHTKAPVPGAQTLERMLYYLKLTREAEARIEQVLYRQGKIVGGVYVGRGQEAIGVGSAIQLFDGDVVLPSHRDFSSFLIRGFSLREIFCNWMARSNGPCHGRDNTLHIGDMSRGVIPIISHLGDTCPVACGVGMVLKWRKRGNVALVHFGEGTSSRGDVHEAMNMAAVMKLPIIFICNNNSYAYSTPTEKQYAVKDLAVRGAAYGMPGVKVDGNDVLAVYSTVEKALRRARSGDGPSFIECKTFRMTGHSAHDAAEYVPRELFAKWKKKDPILRLEKLLLAKKVLNKKQVDDVDADVKKQVDDAVAFAEASPFPEGADTLEGVYCDDGCWWKNTPVE